MGSEVDKPVPSGAQCNARTPKGELCRAPAGNATEHPGVGRCNKHGGSNPAYYRNLVKTGRVPGLIAHVDSVEITPLEALHEELKRTEAVVRYLDHALEEQGSSPGEPLSADQVWWINAHQAERAHLLKVAKAGNDVGIQERHARLDQQEGRLMAGIVEAVLRDVELTSEQWAKVPDAVQRYVEMAQEDPEEALRTDFGRTT